MHRNEVTIAGTGALAAGAALTSIFASPIPVLRVPAAMLLVFVLPGYALTSLLASEARLTPWERVTLVLGLSLSVAALGAVLLNLTPAGVSPASWTLFLGATTIIVVVGALLRTQPPAPQRTRPLLRLYGSRRQCLLLATAGLVILSALLVAKHGADSQVTPAFTQLWLRPMAGMAERVQVGVANGEHATVVYGLVLTDNGTPVATWNTITLAPGQHWQATATLTRGPPSRDALLASLVRVDAPNVVYRQVTLQIGI